MTSYSTLPSSVSLEEVACLYEAVNFGKAEQYVRDPSLLAHLFGPGVFGGFARDPEGKLIGMVRAFSDDRICTWVCEVCVVPSSQRQSVGTALVKLVLDRYAHTAIYAEAFEGQETFFEQLGIKARPQLVACSRAPLTLSA